MLPLVSILLPCYNAEKYLDYSLESILKQDYPNLEVICINDGSTDRTLDMLKQYQAKDPRIVVVDNVVNKGLIETLNISFGYIKGEYFARMDADDYSLPDRISKQVKFLTENPRYDLISTGHNFFIKNGVPLEYVPPLGKLPNSLKFISLFSTPLKHPSVFGKISLIKSGKYYYDKNFLHSEDFELFSRLTWQGVSLANVPDSLCHIRQNPMSVSALYTDIQINTHLRITRRNLEQNMALEDNFDDVTLKILSNRIDVPVTLDQLKTALALLKKYYWAAFTIIKYSDEEEKEVKDFFTLHLLNILIQSNKIRFIHLKHKNTGYFLRTLFMLKLNQVSLILTKLGNYIKYRV